MAAPTSDLVTLRWLALDAVDAGHWPNMRSLLDEEEQARAAAFHFEHDRLAYVAAHALTRLVLSQRAPRPARAWRFTRGPHGKPAVDDGALEFNLSHTRGLVAVAVCEAGDLGVDVEHLDPRRLGPDLTDQVFAPAERAQLERFPAEARPQAAYDFWTLKEAYIKAIGLGLSCPLDAVEFTLDPFSARFSPALGEDPGRWRFERLRPTPDHLLAIALKSPAMPRWEIDARPVRADELAAPSNLADAP